jgi:hypothetical protein
MGAKWRSLSIEEGLSSLPMVIIVHYQINFEITFPIQKSCRNQRRRSFSRTGGIAMPSISETKEEKNSWREGFDGG